MIICFQKQDQLTRPSNTIEKKSTKKNIATNHIYIKSIHNQFRKTIY